MGRDIESNCSNSFNNWRLEPRPCPSCGSKEFKEIGRRGGAAHHAHMGIETMIVSCCTCRLIYPYPFPIPITNPYKAHSAKEYFKIHDSQIRVRLGESIADQAYKFLNRTGRVLEVGSGRGELLRGFANKGWDVLGVEMTEEYAAIAREQFGIQILIEPFEKASLPENHFDVVLLAAALEHLYEPRSALLKIRQVLVPGGIIFIDVPNERALITYIGNLYWRFRGKRWAINLSPTFPPFHVVGFSPYSLRWLLNATGFDVVSLNLCNWISALPSNDSYMRSIEKLAMDAFLKIGYYIGMGAGIICWARSQ